MFASRRKSDTKFALKTNAGDKVRVEGRSESVGENETISNELTALRTPENIECDCVHNVSHDDKDDKQRNVKWFLLGLSPFGSYSVHT